MRVIVLTGKFESAFFKNFVCRYVIFVGFACCQPREWFLVHSTCAKRKTHAG